MGQTCSCYKDQPTGFEVTDEGTFEINKVPGAVVVGEPSIQVSAASESNKPQMRRALSNERYVIADSQNSDYRQADKLNLPLGVLYEGESSEGKPHGRGRMTYLNGDEYIGNFINGIKSGYGIFYKNDTFTYRGNFEDDEMNGFGTKEFLDGRVEKGRFHKGQLME